MWIQKLGWISHQTDTGDDLPILTIDIDPIQLRVITGSADDLRIWRFVCLLDGGKSPTLLAVLTEHQGNVNCARWSPLGNKFASAADDWKILIWEYAGSTATPVQGSEGNIEDWKAVCVLAGHKSDVREVAWSSDGSLLASGSLDNTVLIWKYGQMFPVQSLDGGQVMGLAFDPMSEFLVSLAEDTVMNIWSMKDWHSLRQVQGVFKRSSSQPLKRLSVSPDGRFIVAPGPRKTTFKYMASAYTRDTWEVDMCLVGHLQTLSVTKCSPVLYRQQDGSLTWCVALGSYDCGVSIWRMGEDRPLVVRDLFESAVTDIAWSPDGQHVVACSSDGSVVLIALGGEMGQAVERTETLQYLRGIYGEFPLPVGNQSVNMSISVAEIRENDAFFRTQSREMIERGTDQGQPLRIPSRDDPPVPSSLTSTTVLTDTNPEPPPLPALPDLLSLPFAHTFSAILHAPIAIRSPLTSTLRLTKSYHSPVIYVQIYPEEYRNCYSKARIRCLIGETILWEELSSMIPEKIAGNGFFTAIGYKEGYLGVFTAAGRNNSQLR